MSYDWYGSPSNEYTVSIYSKFKDVKITDSIRSTNMINMDGSIPSGFKNSTYCGMDKKKCSGSGDSFFEFFVLIFSYMGDFANAIISSFFEALFI